MQRQTYFHMAEKYIIKISGCFITWFLLLFLLLFIIKSELYFTDSEVYRKMLCVQGKVTTSILYANLSLESFFEILLCFSFVKQIESDLCFSETSRTSKLPDIKLLVERWVYICACMWVHLFVYVKVCVFVCLYQIEGIQRNDGLLE